jgi:hypothetical protein
VVAGSEVAAARAHHAIRPSVLKEHGNERALINAEPRGAWDRDGCVTVRKHSGDEAIAILSGAIEGDPVLPPAGTTGTTPRARPRAWPCGATRTAQSGFGSVQCSAETTRTRRSATQRARLAGNGDSARCHAIMRRGA